jgi:hypothetical protein
MISGGGVKVEVGTGVEVGVCVGVEVEVAVGMEVGWRKAAIVSSGDRMNTTAATAQVAIRPPPTTARTSLPLFGPP